MRQQERSAAFQGSGFRLGDNEGPSAVVPGALQDTKPAEKVECPPFSFSLSNVILLLYRSIALYCFGKMVFPLMMVHFELETQMRIKNS